MGSLARMGPKTIRNVSVSQGTLARRLAQLFVATALPVLMDYGYLKGFFKVHQILMVGMTHFAL